MTSSISLKPIGVVRSCFGEKFGTPRQSLLIPEAEGTLELFPWVQPELSLEGLENFSHVWVLSWFHESGEGFIKAKIHPPRMEGQTTGVFACRSPHRYNPIGLSVFEILSFTKTGVRVRGLDLIDGTPILDLKPYVPLSDCHPEATGSWTESPLPAVEITFSPEATAVIEENPLMPPEQLQGLIRKVLEGDPRPLRYRKKGTMSQPYGDTYGFLLHQWNVVFQVGEGTTRVLRLDKAPTKSAAR